MEKLEDTNERPFVWGSFVWNMFGFRAVYRHEVIQGINDKRIGDI